jgi:DNA end-binding protein Ku
VKLYSATEKKDISFHLLHDKDNTRIRDMKWCPLEDKAVEWEELVRGYEYAKGKYVKMTPEDFEKLPLPSKHMIEISAFVKTEEIDPVYYEKSYYLEADEAATKPFVLFMRALTDKQMIGIGTVAIRNKERLCALRPLGGTLMMDTLLYPDEIRVTGEEGLPRTRISEAEMDMAYRLVDLMAKPFAPEDYKDHYREALMKVIEAKLEGEELVEEPIAAPSGKVVDLMEALRASVESATKTGGKSARAEEEEEEEDHPKGRRRASHKDDDEKETAAAKPHKTRKRKKAS